MNSIVIKWIIISLMFVLGWCWFSSILAYYLITHHWHHVSPFLFISVLVHFYAVKSVAHALCVSGFAGALIMGILFVLFSKTKVPDIYGKAHFASFHDVKKAGLFAKRGVLLGKAFSKHLRLSGYEHVTVFAPTGTGKTTSITIPNLLDWQESCVVSDIKLQLFKTTSKYRESIGDQVYLWSLGTQDGISHCYNPLDIIGRNPHTRIDEIQKIAEIFIPNNHEGECIWEPQARMLFVALTLYVLDTEGLSKTISTVVKLFKSQSNFIEFIEKTLSTRDDLESVCCENFMKFAELGEKTRSSVTFTFTSHFELFDNPLIIAATSRSDFNIRELRKKKMTIYVGVTNDNLVRLSPLLTVFYQQVTDVMMRNIPAQDEPYGVLLLMDEFSALRRMDSFHKNIGLFREYKLRLIIIIQELSQLYDLYGREGAKVFVNAKVRIAFTQNDEETSEYIETLLGKNTIAIKQTSRNIASGILGNQQRSESIHYAARPLLLSQEIRLLPEKRALILMQGYPAIYAYKIVWFKSKKFKERMLGAVKIPSLLPKVENIISQNKSTWNENLFINTEN